MPLGWPCITSWMPCPGQQLLSRHEQMAGRVHPPQTCCLRPPDLPVRGASTCSETARVTTLSPSCWPRKAGGGALGQRMLWGHQVCLSPAAFCFGALQVRNPRGNAPTVPPPAAVSTNPLPCSSQAQVPASWAQHFQLSPALLGRLGSFQHWIRLTSTPSMEQHPPGRGWAVPQNTHRSGPLIVTSPWQWALAEILGFSSLGRKRISLFVLGRCQQDNGESSECCAREILPTSAVCPGPEQPGEDERCSFSLPGGSGLTASPGTGTPGLVLGVWIKAALKGPGLGQKCPSWHITVAAPLQGRLLVWLTPSSLKAKVFRPVTFPQFPKETSNTAQYPRGWNPECLPRDTQGSIRTTEHPCSMQSPLLHSEMYTGQRVKKSSFTQHCRTSLIFP